MKKLEKLILEVLNSYSFITETSGGDDLLVVESNVWKDMAVEIAAKSTQKHPTQSKTLVKKEEEYDTNIIALFNEIIKHFPEYNLPETDDQKNKWLKCLKLLRDKDGLSLREIYDITRKTRGDDFWSKNFNTILKLRLKNKEGIAYWKVFKSQLTKTNKNEGFAKLAYGFRNED